MDSAKKKELLDLAADHFDGDLELAAAAEIFGLGVVKMKKGIPEHATGKERSAVAAVLAEIRPSPPKGARTRSRSRK